jgi:hypothetical protein
VGDACRQVPRIVNPDIVAIAILWVLPFSLPRETRTSLHVSTRNCSCRFRKLVKTHT